MITVGTSSDSKPRYFEYYRQLWQDFYRDVFFTVKDNSDFFSDCAHIRDYVTRPLELLEKPKEPYAFSEAIEEGKRAIPGIFANRLTEIMTLERGAYQQLFNSGAQGIERLKEIEGIREESIRRFERKLSGLERLYKKWEKKTIFVVSSKDDWGWDSEGRDDWVTWDYARIGLLKRERPIFKRMLFALRRDDILTFQELLEVVGKPPFDEQLIRIIKKNPFYKRWLFLAAQGTIAFYDGEDLMRYCVNLFRLRPQFRLWVEEAFMNKCRGIPAVANDLHRFRRSVFFAFCKKYKYPVGRIMNGSYVERGSYRFEEWGCSKRFLRELGSEALGQWALEAEEEM